MQQREEKIINSTSGKILISLWDSQKLKQKNLARLKWYNKISSVLTEECGNFFLCGCRCASSWSTRKGCSSFHLKHRVL